MDCKVCYGEFIDKMTILEVKLNKIKDMKKLENVKKEYDILLTDFNSKYDLFKNIETEKKKLYILNLCLWNIEDGLRIYEKNKKFDSDFIDLARCVYLMNDKRNFLKNAINRKLDSAFLEVKSYDYLTLEGAKKRVLIIPHQGIGDILMCSSIYRFYDYDHEVVLIAPEKARGTLTQLFEGTTITVEYINKGNSMNDELSVMLPIIEKYNQQGYTMMPLGLHRMAFGCEQQDFSSAKEVFWHVFYRNAGMPYSMMNYGFYFERNMERENELYQKLLAARPEIENGYIVINDDKNRGLNVNENNISSDLPRVYLDGSRCEVFSKNLFDYLTILEKGQEYHSFDTAFSWVVELANLDIPAKYMHTYIRDTILFASYRYLEKLYGEFIGMKKEWVPI